MGATFSSADDAQSSTASTSSPASPASSSTASTTLPSAQVDAPAADVTQADVAQAEAPAKLVPFTSRFAPMKDNLVPVADQTSDTDPQQPVNSKWWRNFERSDLPNPGAYEEINQEATTILRPNLIEGLQFNFNSPLSESFALGNSVEMGAKDRPGSFAFNANYYTNRFLVVTRTTPADGRINGRIFVNHTPALTSKIIADVGLEPDSSKGSWDLDFRGSDFSSQLKVANGGVFAVSYLQSVAPWLALGGEGFYQSNSRFSALTMAAKLKHGKDTASLSIASFGPVIASYVHRVDPKVSFATELFVDTRSRDSHLTLGYRFDLKSASVIGHVDSSGRVAATLEERINPALTLSLSGELDHSREDYKFGFGVNIGGG